MRQGEILVYCVQSKVIDHSRSRFKRDLLCALFATTFAWTQPIRSLDRFLLGVIIQQLNFGTLMEIDETARELSLLEQIESDPDVTQASLATQLGVAVGTVNWHLKRLIEKGYVKVKRLERRKLRYIITPEGLALRARLTLDYVDRSFDLYRRTRQRVKEHLQQVRSAGYDQIRLIGEGDVADICRLTCLEQGIDLTDEAEVPTLEVRGLKVILHLGDGK
jgi:DNA-binding MarR family transcriptional regulator